MNVNTPTTITAQGLLLRPFEGRDAPAFTKAVPESVETVGNWMPWCHEGYTDKDALDWFALCRQSRKAKTAYEFGIFSEDGSEFWGGGGLNEVNNQQGVCNLGYWVRQSMHRQKVDSRCVQALFQCIDIRLMGLRCHGISQEVNSIDLAHGQSCTNLKVAA
jgi:ribosomal-protein-serine acetyltransferase